MKLDLSQCILAITLWAGMGLFCPSLAKAAAPECSGLFSSEYDLKGRIEVQAAVVGQLPITAYAKRLAEIDALLGNLAPATDSPILVGTEFRASSYALATKKIYLGLRTPEMGKKNSEINLNVLAHEYGHAVFEKNLQKDLESYQVLIKEIIKVESQIAQATEMNKRLTYRADVTLDKSMKADLLALAKDKADDLQILWKRYKGIQGYWSVRSALHELFADAVSLAVTKDPKSIERVLSNKEERYKQHSSHDIILRDMTDGRNHKNVQTWNRDAWLHTKIGGDIYYAFLPARWALWKVSKSRIGGEQYRKEFLTKVFTILERHLSETLARSADDIGYKGFKNIEKMNQQIIEDFQREL